VVRSGGFQITGPQNKQEIIARLNLLIRQIEDDVSWEDA
jgi:hypothetical protein